jgi:hypothetical protein
MLIIGYVMWCNIETKIGLRDAWILEKSVAEEDENLQLTSSKVKALMVPLVTQGQSKNDLAISFSTNLSSDREFLKHKKVGFAWISKMLWTFFYILHMCHKIIYHQVRIR